MGKLTDQILAAIRSDQFVFGAHALERLRQRRIPLWQAGACCGNGQVLAERSDAKPNPSIEIRATLPDGTEVKAVWSWLPNRGQAKLVTVTSSTGNPMPTSRNIKVAQWVEGRSKAGPFVVRIMVDAVIPDEDPSEPCFEPAALRLLDEAQRLADAGDVDALTRLGDVYIRKSA